jgi:hypothetical protein
MWRVRESSEHRPGPPPGISFDPSLYPRTYSVSRQHQTYWIVAGLACAVGFPSLLWQSHGMSPLQKVLVAPPLALFGGYMLLEAFKLKLILEPDALTVQRSFSSRRMLRCEIAGRRTMNSRGTTTRILVPQDQNQRPFTFPEIMRTDQAFFAWFEGIPNINS